MFLSIIFFFTFYCLSLSEGLSGWRQPGIFFGLSSILWTVAIADSIRRIWSPKLQPRKITTRISKPIHCFFLEIRNSFGTSTTKNIQQQIFLSSDTTFAKLWVFTNNQRYCHGQRFDSGKSAWKLSLTAGLLFFGWKRDGFMTISCWSYINIMLSLLHVDLTLCWFYFMLIWL